MTTHEQRLVCALKRRLAERTPAQIVEYLLREGLLNRAAMEQCAIRDAVAHYVKCGMPKLRAIDAAAAKMNCSYEKARAAVYRRRMPFNN